MNTADLRPASRRSIVLGMLVIAAATLAIAGLIVFAVWAFSGWGEPTWLFSFSAGVTDSLEWSIGTFVAALLAFYAVSIGGQVLSIRGHAHKVDEIAKTRNALGLVACLIGAASLVELTLVVIDALRRPESWGVVFALALVTAVILFLAANLGFQITSSIPDEISDIETALARISATLTRIRPDDSRIRESAPWSQSVTRVWLLTSLGGAALGVVTPITWALMVAPNFVLDARVLVFYGVGCVGGFLAAGLAAAAGLSQAAGFDGQLDSGGISRFFMPVVLGVGGLVYFAILVIACVFSNGLVRFTLAGIAASLAFGVLSSCWPVRWSTDWLRARTIRGASVSIAVRELDERQRDLSRQLAALRMEHAARRRSASRLGRLRRRLGELRQRA